MDVDLHDPDTTGQGAAQGRPGFPTSGPVKGSVNRRVSTRPRSTHTAYPRLLDGSDSPATAHSMDASSIFEAAPGAERSWCP
jgi:hypothetical protein